MSGTLPQSIRPPLSPGDTEYVHALDDLVQSAHLNISINLHLRGVVTDSTVPPVGIVSGDEGGYKALSALANYFFEPFPAPAVVKLPNRTTRLTFDDPLHTLLALSIDGATGEFGLTEKYQYPNQYPCMAQRLEICSMPPAGTSSDKIFAERSLGFQSIVPALKLRPGIDLSGKDILLWNYFTSLLDCKSGEYRQQQTVRRMAELIVKNFILDHDGRNTICDVVNREIISEMRKDSELSDKFPDLAGACKTFIPANICDAVADLAMASAATGKDFHIAEFVEQYMMVEILFTHGGAYSKYDNAVPSSNLIAAMAACAGRAAENVIHRFTDKGLPARFMLAHAAYVDRGIPAKDNPVTNLMLSAKMIAAIENLVDTPLRDAIPEIWRQDRSSVAMADLEESTSD
jgi:hypothetical protein